MNMKFCAKCGNEMMDEAIFCSKCGCEAKNYAVEKPIPQAAVSVSPLKTAAKILMIISTVVLGIYIFPLAWYLPMTISYCKKLKKGEPISLGFKICVLLFVDTISGILLLCDKD